MKRRLEMAFVWFFSAFISMTGQSHARFQRQLAETISNKYYMENAKTLAALSKEDYELAEQILAEMIREILDAPTFYESARRVIAYARSRSTEYNRIMKASEK